MTRPHHPVVHDYQDPEGCGVASVQVIARFYGRDYLTAYVDGHIPKIHDRGGTWLQCLGSFFRNEGFSTGLLLHDPEVLAPQTYALCDPPASDAHPQVAQKIYAMGEYLRRGGEFFGEPTLDALIGALRVGPLIIGGSTQGFIRGQGLRPISRKVEGHFAIVYGFDGDRFLICDTDDEEPRVPFYRMDPAQIMETMEEGTVTGDNGFLLAVPSYRN